MTAITVFGAGAMGTALAIHLGAIGRTVTLWGSEFDARVLPSLEDERRHPALPAPLPDAVRVLGPDDIEKAAAGATFAVLAANSGGARSLATIVAPFLSDARAAVSIAKGLEPETAHRVSEVYGEVLRRPVVAVGGPCLAGELAEGLPTSVVYASGDADALAVAAETFAGDRYVIEPTSDVAGVEYCGTIKNVAAIGAGIIEGLGKAGDITYSNARAALFSRAVAEMAALVEALGGRRETALGLAGMGDLLVTSLGGRNRAYGELVGSGVDPHDALEDMVGRGMTVEGVDSARDVQELAANASLDLPIHGAVVRIVHEQAPPATILDVLR